MVTIAAGKPRFRRPINRSNQGNPIMGDRSPKANSKHEGQKQAKNDKASQQKQQAITAKYATVKKK